MKIKYSDKSYMTCRLSKDARDRLRIIAEKKDWTSISQALEKTCIVGIEFYEHESEFLGTETHQILNPDSAITAAETSFDQWPAHMQKAFYEYFKIKYETRHNTKSELQKENAQLKARLNI